MLNFYVVAERYHRIQNPLLPEEVELLGEVCGLKPGMRVLDMGSGKGEPALILAKKYGVSVTGVDHMKEFAREARASSKKHGLDKTCKFHLGEGQEFKIRSKSYDLVMALGTSFIFGGFQETVKALRIGVREGGYMAIGEPYWKHQPVPTQYLKAEEMRESDFGSDWENTETIREQGGELVYEIHADSKSWDRYEALHWIAVDDWARENPKHPKRMEFVNRMRRFRESYARWGRDYLGWAVYVSRW